MFFFYYSLEYCGALKHSLTLKNCSWSREGNSKTEVESEIWKILCLYVHEHFHLFVCMNAEYGVCACVCVAIREREMMYACTGIVRVWMFEFFFYFEKQETLCRIYARLTWNLLGIFYYSWFLKIILTSFFKNKFNNRSCKKNTSLFWGRGSSEVKEEEAKNGL